MKMEYKEEKRRKRKHEKMKGQSGFITVDVLLGDFLMQLLLDGKRFVSFLPFYSDFIPFAKISLCL